MKTFICHCEQQIDLDIPDVLDLDGDTARKAEIASGTFLTTTCPRCGTVLRPEIALRVQSAKFKLDAFVLPELERLAVYREKADVPNGCEVLLGYSELMERVKILDAGLDPMVVEIIKYYVQNKAEETEPGADIDVFFSSLKDEKLVFHVRGFSSGDSGVLNIPRSTYESTKTESASMIKKKPFSSIFTGNYRSIKKLSVVDDDE